MEQLDGYLLMPNTVCVCHFGPCIISRGLNSKPVSLKNLKSPNGYSRDLFPSICYTAKMQNSSHEPRAILLRSLMHAAKTDICHNKTANSSLAHKFSLHEV